MTSERSRSSIPFRPLSPCPFCGGEAEMDTLRPVLALGTGRPGTGVAVYCRTCPAEIMLCRGDVPEVDGDMVADLWNARTDRS